MMKMNLITRDYMNDLNHIPQEGTLFMERVCVQRMSDDFYRN